MTNKDELKESLTEQVILKVIERIHFEHGDVIVINAVDDETMQIFATMLNDLLDIKVLLVKEGNIEFVAEIDEEYMATLGWYRKEPNVKLVGITEITEIDGTPVIDAPKLAEKIEDIEYTGLDANDDTE